MEQYEVQPVARPVSAEIRPPGSKSITNRACICAGLAAGRSVLNGVLVSEDTEVMIAALRTLGLEVELTASSNSTAAPNVAASNKLDGRLENAPSKLETDQHSLTVEGRGGRMPVTSADLFCANSGTSIRFLTAALCAVEGEFGLDGIERMRQRPIGDLIDALRQLGASAECSPQGCPPVRIRGKGLAGGSASVAGAISSQFLSGLLMAAPLANAPVHLEVTGELVSKPYVEMTIAVMRAFGVHVQCGASLQHFEIAPQGYIATEYAIEPDASAASYYWAAAAITGGRATVAGLTFDALQGDVNFCRVLEEMGCEVTESLAGNGSITVRAPHKLRGVDVDMNAISDTVQTLSAVALFADGPTHIRGVAHNRHKETDRIGDLARELRKFGARVEETEDGLSIHPPDTVGSAVVETYNDHRMAMSLALVGLRVPNVVILNPACTGKTYPNYWSDLERFTASS